nr:MAG TPA: hypothetical protein [Microviridae sp.]
MYAHGGQLIFKFSSFLCSRWEDDIKKEDSAKSSNHHYERI